jgi:hypothetical protein
MSLPLPAGPDYPLWMPPDGLLDRTRAAVTDRPRPVSKTQREPAAPVVKRQASGPAIEAAGSRTPISQ